MFMIAMIICFMMSSFSDTLIGIVDPGQLNPPGFCEDSSQEEEEEPENVFGV